MGKKVLLENLLDSGKDLARIEEAEAGDIIDVVVDEALVDEPPPPGPAAA